MRDVSLGSTMARYLPGDAVPSRSRDRAAAVERHCRKVGFPIDSALKRQVLLGAGGAGAR